MNRKKWALALVSILTQQSFSATLSAAPAANSQLGGVLERQIAREFSEKTWSQLKEVVPTLAKDLTFNVFAPSAAQIAMLQQEYNASISAAQQLTHELFPTVFYADILSPQQIGQSLAEITRVSGKLAQIDLFLCGEDLPLLNAQENMTRLKHYFSSIGSGQAMSFYQFNPNISLLERKARALNTEEFFLKDPEGIPPGESFVLPREWKVAVLNDDENILNALLRMKKTKEGARWTIDGFLSPEEFLNLSNVHSYDLILTDVNIRPGGGDYLAFRLRRMGYQKPILAISGYDEEPALAQRLYLYGIDGMYAAGTVAALRVPRLNEVMLGKIKNYFYYKEKAQ